MKAELPEILAVSRSAANQYQLQRKLEKRAIYNANRSERDKKVRRDKRQAELADLKLALLTCLQDLKRQQETGIYR